jgi:hypothetical protein
LATQFRRVNAACIRQQFLEREIALQTQAVMPMTMKMPLDARRKLEEWASYNMSNMTAEAVRAIRERAEREQVAAR